MLLVSCVGPKAESQSTDLPTSLAEIVQSQDNDAFVPEVKNSDIYRGLSRITGLDGKCTKMSYIGLFQQKEKGGSISLWSLHLLSAVSPSISMTTQ